MTSKIKSPTKRQTELLILISPKPYGKGLKLTQAAKLLHLPYHKAKYAIHKFRKKYPERWKTIQVLKQQATEDKKLNRLHKKAINRPLLVGALDWADDSNVLENLLFDNNEFDDGAKSTVYMKIKEKF